VLANGSPLAFDASLLDFSMRTSRAPTAVQAMAFLLSVFAKKRTTAWTTRVSHISVLTNALSPTLLASSLLLSVLTYSFPTTIFTNVRVFAVYAATPCHVRSDALSCLPIAEQACETEVCF